MEPKKFNRSEYMKERYQKLKKLNKKNDSTIQVKNLNEENKLEKKKEKQKMYNARAYAKRKAKNIKESVIKNRKNSSSSDEKELVFKINNPEKKQITIKIEI